MEKFLHCGSEKRVLYRGSMDDCVDPLLGIEHYNDSYAVVAWRRSYTVKVWTGSHTLEARDDYTDSLLGIKHHNRILCYGSVEKFLHRGNMERVLFHGSIKDCADPSLGIKHYNRFLRCGNVEKFLHRGSVERVLHCGSMDDYADPLLGIEHHNDSCAVVAWGSSYSVEV